MTELTNAEVLAEAKQLLRDLCKMRGDPGAREWIMSIPARPNDPDLIFAQLIERFEANLGPVSASPQPTFPQPCELCGKEIAERDDTQYHGLGECVPICPTCFGSGIEPEKIDCPDCDGKGKTPTGSAQVPWKLCPKCKTTGKITKPFFAPAPAQEPHCGYWLSEGRLEELVGGASPGEQPPRISPEYLKKCVAVGTCKCVDKCQFDPSEPSAPKVEPDFNPSFTEAQLLKIRRELVGACTSWRMLTETDARNLLFWIDRQLGKETPESEWPTQATEAASAPRPLSDIRDRYESSMSETAFTDAICAAYDLGRAIAAAPSVAGTQPTHTERFSLGFVLGQTNAYLEQVIAGAKLAAQIGCSADHMADVVATIEQEQCFSIVEHRTTDRVGIWMFKHSFVRELIEALKQDATPPTAAEVWAMGKLFGYSDAEIGRYLHAHGLITGEAVNGKHKEASHQSAASAACANENAECREAQQGSTGSRQTTPEREKDTSETLTGAAQGTPQVEEIAREIVKAFANRYGNVGVGHVDIDLVSAILRPHLVGAPAQPGPEQGEGRK